MRRPLRRAFFSRPAVEVARSLIGCILVHDLAEGRRAGRIVETEAYDQNDPASHSCRGLTPRTAVMFGLGGYAYVYRSYGLHWCLNVSTGPRGFGAAVLLRALQPLIGITAMARVRGGDQGRVVEVPRLCRGPGNLTQALAIDQSHNGHNLIGGTLHLLEGMLTDADTLVAGPRIGISVAQDVPWRFYLLGNPYVSGRRGPSPTTTMTTTANHPA